MKLYGFTLFEILLILSVMGAIMLLGIKQYMTFKQYVEVERVKANIHLLLSESSQYYLSHCLSNTSFDKINTAYAQAKTTLDAAVGGLDVTHDLHLSENTLTNPFGQFDDASSYKVTLIKAPFTPPGITLGTATPEQYDKTFNSPSYNTQGFDTTVLWQTRVTTCITRLGYNKKDENSTSPEAIQAYFEADSVSDNDETCTQGVVLVWTRLPRSTAFSAVSMSARGAAAEYNKMGQWAPFMKKVYGSDIFNYLCQT